MNAIQVQNSTTYLMKWAKSKKLLDNFVEQYNGPRPLGEQLRSAHRKLAEYLLYIYSLRLRKAMSYEGLREGQELYTLRRRMWSMADNLGCGVRTKGSLARQQFKL